MMTRHAFSGHAAPDAKQWTDEGKPLYRGMMDKKRGDCAGDGLNTLWHGVD